MSGQANGERLTYAPEWVFVVTAAGPLVIIVWTLKG